MTVPTSNTEYTNAQGSIILPSGAIVPYAGFGNYNGTTPTTSVPSGFLFCDGYWYDPNVYPNLFAVIGYTYGTVAVNDGFVPGTGKEVIANYFRTPNLMNADQTYVFTNPYTFVTRYVRPNDNGGTYTGAGSLFTTIGGVSNAITTAPSVTLSLGQIPSHTHPLQGLLNAGTGSAGATVLESVGNTIVDSGWAGGNATAAVVGEQNQPGVTSAVSLPVPASFVMTYLIKM